MFTATLSSASDQTVTLEYQTGDGTATARSGDYETGPGSVVFLPGETVRTISIPTGNDGTAEDDEHFWLVLTAAEGAEIDRGTAAGKIIDNDARPEVVVSSPTVTVNRGADFLFTLSNPYSEEVTVDYVTADGSGRAGVDFAPRGGKVTFAPGQTVSRLSVATFERFADVWGENPQAIERDFSIALSNAKNAELAAPTSRATIKPDLTPMEIPATATLLPAWPNGPNDPVITVQNATGNEGYSATFYVSVFPVPTETVTVEYQTFDGTAINGDDYFGAYGTLTFYPGESTQAVAIALNSDSGDEPDEHFTLVLQNAYNANIVGGVATAYGTIVDNDAAPVLSITDHSGPESGVRTFVFSLSNPSLETIIVPYMTNGGTATADVDYVSQSGSFTLLPGETTAVVNVPIIPDTGHEAHETFEVTIGTVVGDFTFAGPGTGTIIDDDLPRITLNDPRVAEIDGHVTFTVTPLEDVKRPVTFAWRTIEGTAKSSGLTPDFAFAQGTFPLAEMVLPVLAPPVSFDVSILQDHVDREPNESFSIRISNPQTGNPIAVGGGGATIVDVWADLDTDSDNDGSIEAEEDPIEEDGPGRVVGAYDDLNTSLAQLNLDISSLTDQAFDANADWYLTLLLSNERVKVWDSAARTTLIANGHTWNPKEFYPRSLYVEGVIGGFTMLDLLLRRGSESSGVLDRVRVGICRLDLDIDADNDGTVQQSPAEDALEMTSPGKVIGLNDNDDNHNASEDRLDPSPFVDSQGQPVVDDLTPAFLVIDIWIPELRGFAITFSATPADRVKLWSTASKDSLRSSYTIGADAYPFPLYFEGCEVGQAELQVLVSSPAGVEVFRDKAKTTVVRVDLDVDSDNNNTIERTPEEDAVELESPGKVVQRNDDDSNGNGVQDRLDPSPFVDQQSQSVNDDLDPAQLTYDSGGVNLPGFTVELASDNATAVRLWRTLDKSPLASTYAVGIDPIPETIYVEGYDSGHAGIDLVLKAPNGMEVRSDRVWLTVINPDLEGYRPQTDGPGYGTPFARTAIPFDQELNPGAGIRRNGDDDDGDAVPDRLDTSVAGENDLIELLWRNEPTSDPNLEYVLKRSNGNVKVWRAPDKSTGALLDANNQVSIVPHDPSSPVAAMWAEWVTMDPAEQQSVVTLECHTKTNNPMTNGKLVWADNVRFYPFNSVVIFLGGEGQVPSDPILPADRGNFGTFQTAIDEYRNGYDVHMYDEDNVWWSDADGPPYREIWNAIQNRGVTAVAIIGYSHGGGAVYNLAQRLYRNTLPVSDPDYLGQIGRPFTVRYTAYIDAVTQTNVGAENRRPPLSQFHVNLWRDGDLGGGPSGGDDDIDVGTYAAWGAGLTHTTVDDAAQVIDWIKTRLEQMVER
ncbi:MAG: Calx-beta domain-containing protein [Pirellulales bacterium]